MPLQRLKALDPRLGLTSAYDTIPNGMDPIKMNILFERYGRRLNCVGQQEFRTLKAYGIWPRDDLATGAVDIHEAGVPVSLPPHI